MAVCLVEAVCGLNGLFRGAEPEDLYPVELVDTFNPVDPAALVPVGGPAPVKDPDREAVVCKGLPLQERPERGALCIAEPADRPVDLLPDHLHRDLAGHLEVVADILPVGRVTGFWRADIVDLRIDPFCMPGLLPDFPWDEFREDHLGEPHRSDDLLDDDLLECPEELD